ncbi:uncharacterized protein LOC100369616 [Saccoglossus kowalevskii]|uniref:Uncharacterized protein LOC100369616 n=1 Tax=Saccoglossus kowalevskii TaxID=10224 RepID=A0ABM0M872_SACKO|nr:PREDICTED: uncharacterized protein LOC100369616 [Saccoglossus kowalevskii]
MVQRNARFGIETNRTLKRCCPTVHRRCLFSVTKYVKLSSHCTAWQEKSLIQDLQDGYPVEDGNLQLFACHTGNTQLLSDQQQYGGYLKFSLNKKKRWLLSEILQQYICSQQKIREFASCVRDFDLHSVDDVKVTLIEHETTELLREKADCIQISETHTDKAIKIPASRKYSFKDDLRKKPNHRRNRKKQCNNLKGSPSTVEDKNDIFSVVSGEVVAELVYDVFYGREKTTYPAYKEIHHKSRYKRGGSTKKAKKSKGEKEKHYYYWNGYHRNEMKGGYAAEYYEGFSDDWFWKEDFGWSAEDEPQKLTFMTKIHVQQKDTKSLRKHATNYSQIHVCFNNPDDLSVTQLSPGISRTPGPLQSSSVFRCHRCGNNKTLRFHKEREGSVILLLKCDVITGSKHQHEHDTPYRLQGCVRENLKTGWMYHLPKDQAIHLIRVIEEISDNELGSRPAVSSLVGDVADHLPALIELRDMIRKHLTFLEGNSDFEDRLSDNSDVSLGSINIEALYTSQSSIKSCQSTESNASSLSSQHHMDIQELTLQYSPSDNVSVSDSRLTASPYRDLIVIGAPALKLPKSPVSIFSYSQRSSQHINKTNLEPPPTKVYYHLPHPPPMAERSKRFVRRRKPVVNIVDTIPRVSTKQTFLPVLKVKTAIRKRSKVVVSRDKSSDFGVIGKPTVLEKCLPSLGLLKRPHQRVAIESVRFVPTPPRDDKDSGNKHLHL